MTLTVITGEAIGTQVIPAPEITWDDLGSSPFGSWDTWNTWRIATGTTISMRIDDDLGSIDYRIPEIIFDYQGDATISLKISDTGTFTGEETDVVLDFETPVAFTSGRYYRWSISITSNSETSVPMLYEYFTRYTDTLSVEILNDVDVLASYTTNLNTNLGLVRNIQATALQGDPYVVDGYILSADENTFRPQETFTNNGVTLTSPTSIQNKFSGFPVLDFTGDSSPAKTLEFDTFTAFDVLESTSDWTLEMWIKLDSLSTSQRIIGQYDVDGTRTGNSAWGLDYSHLSGTLQWIGGSTTTTEYNLQATGIISAGTWHHIAVVRNGANAYLYIDGTQRDTNTYYDTDVQTSSVFIGEHDSDGDDTTNAFDFDGYMTNIRISDMARYTSNFTAPTGPFTNDANTKLLISSRLVDENGYEDGGVDYIITQSGGSPVIKQKNPPQVQVVDYEGNPWDGTIDVVLRGFPKIQFAQGGVVPITI